MQSQQARDASAVRFDNLATDAHGVGRRVHPGVPMTVDMEDGYYRDMCRTLEHIFNGLDMTNLLFAGGSVLGALTAEKGFENSDVDIFMHGLSPAAAASKCEAVCEHLAYRLCGYACIKSRVAITFVPSPEYDKWCTEDDNDERFVRCPDTLPAIQVILTAFKSPYHVLSSFNLDCCGVGYAGTQVLATSQAIRAITHRTNIFDPTTYTSTFVPYWC